MRGRIEVVGIGSRLRADDAVGLHLVEALSEHPEVQTHLWEDRDGLDLATLLLDLPGPALIVDCAQLGLPPGQGRAFSAEQAQVKMHARCASTHGFGLAEGLALAKELGLAWPARFFGVQPYDLSGSPELSPEMQLRLPALRALLWREAEPITQGFTLRGCVQGVGMRPTLHRLVQAVGLGGTVCNTAGTVQLKLSGSRGRVQAFMQTLPPHLPTPSHDVHIEAGPEQAFDAARDFVIQESLSKTPPSSVIPADLVMCNTCEAEVLDPDNRRFGYAFTTCTHCGPRYTVVHRTPYDRARTTLAGFELCADCAREYHDPKDRRFHAESTACPECGPQLQALTPDGQCIDGDPLEHARRALADGKVVAVLGIGGFSLAVDARQAPAIQRLRDLKHRPHKPFAVMARDARVARSLCAIGPQELQALTSVAGPIVLLPTLPQADLCMQHLAPDTDRLGLMLPTSPLHALLFKALPGDPTADFDLLVMTSGNAPGEPIVWEPQAGLQELDAADLFLVHDRAIVQGCDDSVLAQLGPNVQPLRRARGYAPDPIPVRHPIDRPALALGAAFKNTVALAVDGQVLLSPHLPDPETPAAQAALRAWAHRLPQMLDRPPGAVAVDLHPDLSATRIGEQLAADWQVPLVRVQHHHAHAVACMAEHGLHEALALVYDGVGYGEDGALWGGELLHVHEQGFERLGTFAPARLPGGDAAVKEPLRQLVARCLQAGLPTPEQASPDEAQIWQHQTRIGLNAPQSHAVGRLFDAAAAALGLAPAFVTWQGQAAVRLQTAAERFEGTPPDLNFPLDEGVVQWQGAFRRLASPEASTMPEAWAAALHHGLAQASARLVEWGLDKRPGLPIVLSGGVFQNALLVRLLLEQLNKQEVYSHRRLPCNDGGLSLGQALVAARRPLCV